MRRGITFHVKDHFLSIVDVGLPMSITMWQTILLASVHGSCTLPITLFLFDLESILDISWLNQREIIQFICFILIFGATVHTLIEIIWTLVHIFRRSKRTPQEDCPICLEIIEERCTLKCTHQFCYPCIAKHLTYNSNCPCCRKEIYIVS